jgi:hypothetical protein
MSDEPVFNPAESKIVRDAKRTMVILARIIRDKDVKKVITDPDLAQRIGHRPLEEAIAADPALGEMIKARVTPDLPLLNAAEETSVICALGSAIFNRLSDAESDDNP